MISVTYLQLYDISSGNGIPLYIFWCMLDKTRYHKSLLHWVQGEIEIRMSRKRHGIPIIEVIYSVYSYLSKTCNTRSSNLSLHDYVSNKCTKQIVQIYNTVFGSYMYRRSGWSIFTIIIKVFIVNCINADWKNRIFKHSNDMIFDKSTYTFVEHQ